MLKILREEIPDIELKRHGDHVIFRINPADPVFGAIVSPQNNTSNRLCISPKWNLIAAHLATLSGKNGAFNPNKNPTSQIIFGKNCFLGGFINLRKMGLSDETQDFGTINQISFTIGCDKKHLFSGIQANAQNIQALEAITKTLIEEAKKDGITDPFEALGNPFDNIGGNPFQKNEQEQLIAISNALVRGLNLTQDQQTVTLASGFPLALLGFEPGRQIAETNPFDNPSEPQSRPKGFGTGFFITTDGYLLTNHHVVEGANKVTLKIDDKEIPAKIIKIDEQNDLAVLKADGKFQALPLISSRKVKLGDPVFTLGFPRPNLQGQAVKMTSGRISSLSGIKDDARNFQISVPIQPGNSGGPLINENGNVIGVVVSKLNAAKLFLEQQDLPQNVNYAVKSSFASGFVESLPKVSENLLEAIPIDEDLSEGARIKLAIQKGQKSTVMIIVR